MNRILITGGTGFIGSFLIPFFISQGKALSVLSRDPKQSQHPSLKYYRWDIENKFIDRRAFEGVDTIINLVGANIASKRWTNSRKQIILKSRIDTSELLYESVSRYGTEVECVISSSAIGYYGAFNSDRILTEEDPNGRDFIAEVCRQWEMVARKFEELGSRVVILRKAAVLGREGGMYKRLSTFARFGLNTAVGDGEHFLPWIYIKDLLNLYLFIMKEKKLTGIFNAVSSAHTSMNEFSTALAKTVGMPVLTPNAPAFMIKLLYGELSELLLHGSRVSNDKLVQSGFVFKYNSIVKVLRKIAMGKDDYSDLFIK